ncbi:MAG: ABC transporter ATP-binding protein/permease [Acetatifactor sp.]|nr:ABC transporter ATP-binding protein/permease [Acetatifactor sp.]
MVKAGIRNGYMLLLFLIFSFVLNEVVILGNDLIAEATDLMLIGQPVNFSEFIVPLLWMVALGTVAAFLKSIFGKHYSATVQKEVRISLGRHLMKLPFSYFDEKGTGSLLTRLISDLDEMGRFFSEILPELLMNLIIVLTSTVYLVRMDAMLIVVLFASYPVMLVVSDRLSKKLAEITKKLRTHMDERAETAYDAIQGIMVGRSYNLYELHRQKLNTVIDNMVMQVSKSTRISTMGWVLKNAITTVPVIFCYLFALHEIRQGRITVGDMLAFTVILSRILYPIGDIVFCANDIREVGVSLKRIQEIYNRQEERQDGRITLETGMRDGQDILYKDDMRIPKERAAKNETPERNTLQSESGALRENNIHRAHDSHKTIPAIRWQDVYFSYDDSREQPVLRGMSFSVEIGAQTAFVGGSGEGKTTIFKLLCGLYEKSGGQYLLFGHPFEEWNLAAARSCFSEVSQNVFLFPETIRQNVACGKENATEEEIVEACKNANIHDFILQLPDGYDTLVGERGVLLSGGQRQRISIARAFLKDAPILLLDEPTASVDIESEHKIQEAIDRISAVRTVIVIAPRLSTVKNARKI